MQTLIRHAATLLVTCALALAARTSLADDRWTGEIHLPGGSTLPCTIQITPAQGDSPATGAIDIPAQKVTGAVLNDLTIDPDGLMRFTYKPEGVGEKMWCVFTVRPHVDRGRATGHMRQMGQLFAVTFEGEIGAAQGPKSLTKSESWRGIIHLPGSQTLGFTASFTVAETITATMDIPSQGLLAGELHDVNANQSEMTFTLKPTGAPEQAWARFFAVRSKDGASALGTMKQMGSTFAVEMEAAIEGKPSTIGRRRPQHPLPPFPYASRDVTYVNHVSHFKLAGTLTIPEAEGPHPCAILITGSGAEDRDETLFEHKPFLVIADHLTRRGIAVLRVDDRGVGGSTGNSFTATSADFATDVAAGIEFLKTQSDIDPGRIGLIGHSEGGIIAPLVAADHPDDVAFIVLLAAPGVTGREIALRQSVLIAKASGASDASIKIQATMLPPVLDLIESGAPMQEIQAAIRTMAAEQARSVGIDPESPQGESIIRGVVGPQSEFLSTPWMRWFLKHDPRPVLTRVKCPVLALTGELDTQVPAQENLDALAAALREGGNDRVVTRILPGLNHLFQTATTGGLEEYAEIEETFAPIALDAMTQWIRARAGLTE